VSADIQQLENISMIQPLQTASCLCLQCLSEGGREGGRLLYQADQSLCHGCLSLTHVFSPFFCLYSGLGDIVSSLIEGQCL